MSDSNTKKTGHNKFNTGVFAALVTALSSSGLFGLFNLFDDDDDGVRGGFQGSPTTGIHQFITSSTRESVVDLEGDWKLATGDDIGWANRSFDDSSWGTVDVPSHWESEGFEDYDGYAWYRKRFSIQNKDIDDALFVFLGSIDDVDETYINGQKIGGQGRFDPVVTAWDRNRVYRIPTGLLQPGEDNVIAVRVLDTQLGGGIYRGDIGIYRSILPQPLVDLAGVWEFQTGDDPTWKDLGAAVDGFTIIQVPMSWEAEGFDGYDGFAWYRKRFGGIGVSDSQSLVLLLGKIDDTDEVFLNGELIGKTGALDSTDLEIDSNYYSYSRVYPFSASLLGDDNILAVRVHDSGGLGGLYSGPVGIMTEEDYEAGLMVAEEADKVSFGDVVDWLLGRD